MDIQKIKESLEKVSNKKWVNLKDNESIEGVFRGDHHEIVAHWVDRKKEDCRGKECVLCRKGDRPRYRFALNFFERTNNSFDLKIFELSKTVLESFLKHWERYGVDKVLYEIQRSGSGTDTKFQIFYKMDLKEDELEIINSTPLYDLHTEYSRTP